MVLQIIQLISVESMLVKMLVSNILKKKMEEFPQHVTSVLNVRGGGGAYITFIDPDDWVESDYLEVLYRALIDEKADIAISTYKQFNMDDNCYYMHV